MSDESKKKTVETPAVDEMTEDELEQAAGGASDYLLELDGVKGESRADKHKETIEIASFSLGVSVGSKFPKLKK